MNYGRLEHLPLWKLEMLRDQQTRKVEQLEAQARNARRELESLEHVTKLRRGDSALKVEVRRYG